MPGFADILLSRPERRILSRLFRRGPSTQAALIEAAEVTQQSVSRLVAGLGEAGMVSQGERVSSGRRGPPTTLLSMAPNFAYSAGVSIMAGSASLAVLDFSGALRFETRQSLPSLAVPDVLDWAEHKLEQGFEDAGLARDRLKGIGVAVSGSFIENGGFNTPDALEDWAGIDIAERFSSRFGVPAHADNDGNAAAVAESILGVGRWAPSFAYLYIAAGLGGGVVLDGVLWRGRFGNAGEFAGGLPPNTHPFPTLELLRQLLAANGLMFETVEAMVAAFDPDWPAVRTWIAQVKDSLSVIASNATAILDLDAIVLGGMVPPALAELTIPQVDLFDQRRRGTPRPVARLVAAEARGEVAAHGAALLPLERDVLN